ncbi:choline transport protein [Xylona heveae TC161]|uniref:Choline transport protein n=1 Tax=Xylona heveae (strain CBS 132557 / TC161) TaxID=1328760 RepID=A0A164ZS68_XYLHT|nr:choline transport protein [Xylona heveae TC161]KZF19445.1 choline transport protein [Xylona heveae TC161]
MAELTQNDHDKAGFADSEKNVDEAISTQVNASGHEQELDRQFGLVSIISAGIVTGNTWTALGGAIVVALYNGGPPGVIYEFIAVSICYWFVGASIAELASAIPASGGVYHWATVAAGRKYGRPAGWFAGWWNLLAWIFGASANSAIIGNGVLFCYSLYHPDLDIKRWQVFIVYEIITVICCAVVLFCNRGLASINRVGCFFMLGGIFVTVMVCAIMPSYNGKGHASNNFVWADWFNGTGYSSNGLVFLTGMLNGAFAVGTPDCLTHLAEEIPRPSSNIPKAILAQIVVGFITALVYMISIFYSINDFPKLFKEDSVFPLGDIYHQATGSRGGAVGLVIVILLPICCATVGCYTTAGRMLWTLARDGATPGNKSIGKISPRFENPFNATLACGIVSICMGGIFVGSVAAFDAFIGAFVILSTASFLAAIIPNLLSGRRNIRPGAFWMKGWVGFCVNIIACVYMMVFMVLYCFPYAMPATADNMNYSSLVTGGFTIFIAIWWFLGSKNYTGPMVVLDSVTLN